MKCLFKKLGVNNKESLKALILQFIKFTLVGISNVITNLGIYYILVYCKVYYLLANSIGYLIGILNSYFWNSKFVFKRKKNIATTIFKTFVVYGFTLLISTILLYLMVDLINISDKIAPLINLILTTPINFLLNKFWAYKE